MREEDYDLYECVATNELGSDKMEIKLEKAGPPSPPYDIFADNITANGVTIAWSPGFDGGLPQTFKILYRKMGTHTTTTPSNYCWFSQRGELL